MDKENNLIVLIITEWCDVAKSLKTKSVTVNIVLK